MGNPEASQAARTARSSIYGYTNTRARQRRWVPGGGLTACLGRQRLISRGCGGREHRCTLAEKRQGVLNRFAVYKLLAAIQPRRPDGVRKDGDLLGRGVESTYGMQEMAPRSGP
jgi:hypothetical protein